LALGEQPCSVEPGTYPPRLRVLQVWVQSGVENVDDPTVDATTKTFRMRLDPARKIVVQSNCQLRHAFMLAGMNACD
jgi:hypothetical protein